MSRERAKLSYRWLPAVVERWATVDGRLTCVPSGHGGTVP